MFNFGVHNIFEYKYNNTEDVKLHFENSILASSRVSRVGSGQYLLVIGSLDRVDRVTKNGPVDIGLISDRIAITYS